MKESTMNAVEESFYLHRKIRSRGGVPNSSSIKRAMYDESEMAEIIKIAPESAKTSRYQFIAKYFMLDIKQSSSHSQCIY